MNDKLLSQRARTQAVRDAINARRKEYQKGDLLIENVSADPFAQFADWFADASASDLIEPNAMSLATADADGKPSVRIVLLKGFDEHGFVFYTNYTSRKGQELAANPHAGLAFFWDVLERQVRITGTVEKVPYDMSNAYFNRRPKASRLGAMASKQSSVVEKRSDLSDKLAALTAEYAEAEQIDVPDYWGGYRVVPEEIEFWQGRPSRLHDRVVYRKQANGNWEIVRLSP